MCPITNFQRVILYLLLHTSLTINPHTNLQIDDQTIFYWRALLIWKILYTNPQNTLKSTTYFPMATISLLSLTCLQTLTNTHWWTKISVEAISEFDTPTQYILHIYNIRIFMYICLSLSKIYIHILRLEEPLRCLSLLYNCGQL